MRIQSFITPLVFTYLVIIAIILNVLTACNVQSVATNTDVIESTREIAPSTTVPLQTVTTPNGSSEISLDSDLVNTEWQLVKLNGEPFPEEMKLTLFFTPESIHGHTGCNKWEIWGIFTAENGNIFIDSRILMETEGCIRPDLQKEFAFAFAAATSYSLDEDMLFIQDDEGEKSLTFVPLKD